MHVFTVDVSVASEKAAVPLVGAWKRPANEAALLGGHVDFEHGFVLLGNPWGIKETR